jgi:signal transduction histidine kinase
MKKTSLFTKLTVLIFLAALSLAIITHAALFTFLINMRNESPLANGFYRYTKLLTKDINIYDTTAVRSFLDEHSVAVRFSSQNFNWSTSKSIPGIDEIEPKYLDKPVFWSCNRISSVIRTDSGTYIFQGTNKFNHPAFPWQIFFIWLGMMGCIFGLTHLIIGKLIKPVRILHKGVQQVSNGDFNIQLQQNTNDELGQLISSFNHMSRQIRNDIKSRDQLLRDISHELRSPLARMLVALEFVPEGNIRQTLKNNILTLNTMATSILEEERLDSPFGKIKQEKINLNSLFTEIVNSKKEIPPFIYLQSNEPLEINADKERLRMAFSNILENAIKYSKETSDPIKVWYTEENSLIKITITDNGIGIPESEIPFIFEPFYRVDKVRRQNSGYGLGMSLTKKIIDAHAGTISISSIVDKGTTIFITLPKNR